MLAKVREETAEIAEAIGSGNQDAVRDEIGDLLFAVVNLARHLDVDPDQALRGTNAKFIRRFGFIESSLTEQGSSLSESTLDEMETLWAAAKTEEANP